MKLVWVASGLLAWTTLVAVATAVLVPPPSLPSPPRTLREQHPRKAPIEVHVGVWTSELGERWMLADQHFKSANQVHVNHDDLPNGDIHVEIDDADEFSSHVVKIDLHPTGDGKVRADASVEWTSDFGPPFRGAMTDVTGNIALKKDKPSTGEPMVVNFELHGLIEGIPQCVHGEAALPH